MKLVWVSCGACGSEWEAFDRGMPPFCSTCGSDRIEKLLFGGQKRVGDPRRVPREERVRRLGFLFGTEAAKSSKESGDWDAREGEGEDPNDLEAEYWLMHYRAKLGTTLSKDEIVVTPEEESAAADAFREGWDWVVGPTPSTRPRRKT
jgi:hypothetical protein